MSFRIFGLAVVPARYFDRLESVEDELIDLEIRRRREKEDAADALKMALKSKERWKKTAGEMAEGLEKAQEMLIREREGREGAETELEKAMLALKTAEDRLEEAGKELKAYREMGTTLQEWVNLLGYDGSRQEPVSESDKEDK